jgi:phosphinothricin acetyltransferase
VTSLRFARPDDAEAIHAIYEPIVRTTAINFTMAPQTVGDLAARIALATYPWIVALDDDRRMLGYALARPWGSAEGERWSVETGLALVPDARGAGLGTRIYRALLGVLAAQGFHNALAGITVPNPASERLHERLGFRRYGVIERHGWKLDRWHDTSWWQKRLVDGDPPPAELRGAHGLESIFSGPDGAGAR